MCDEEAAVGVKVIVLDVDGVLTDGGVYYDGAGRELMRFDIKDGQGIKMARDAGLTVVIMTGRGSPALSQRAGELGLEIVLQRVSDKTAALESLLKDRGWRAEEVAYVGDDLPDLPAMRRVGLSIAVADAVSEVRETAGYITRRPGGRGAVREAIEFILKAGDR